ncbi:MAG: choice-of-anchor J domain-containing protein [Chitinophagaceae bacterium]|nr:choice-of-anchor J domain-containing protein [Chitinophagaceae bacterium]
MTCSGTEVYSESIQVGFAGGATLPIMEDFANYATQFPPSCWTISNTTYLLGNAASAYGIGLGSIQFGFYNTQNNLEVATPVFSPLPANYRLTFDHAYATFTFGGDDALEILYSTDGGLTYSLLVSLEGGFDGPLNTGGDELFEYVPTSAQWANKAFALPAGVNRILFRGVSGWGNDLYLDNITIEETPACLPPTNLRAAGLSATTHQISWAASPSAPGSGYQWEVRTSGAAGSGAAGLVASGNTAAGVLTATATGLTGNTTYQFFVRSDCSAGLYSSWSMAGNFKTTCDPTNVPYFQNFDNAFSPNLPDCILTEDLNGGGKWQLWYDADIVVSTPPNSMWYTYNVSIPGDDWFFLQGLNLEAGKSYTLSFKYKASDGPTWVENLEVKYGNAPNAAAMTSAAIFSETSISSKADDEFSVATVVFTVPANGVYYIGFRCFSAADNAYLFIDDVSVESCASPANVKAISPTSTTASVSFVSAGSSFIVEYGPVGFTPGTGATAGGGTIVTGATSPINITGLTANTLYDVYIRQSCDGGAEFSGNTKVSVRTLCAPVNLPYTQDFTGVVVPALPACVSLQDLNGGPTWATVTPNAAWGFNGTALRYLYSETTPADDWLFIQGVNLEAGKNYEVSFKYGSTDPLYPERMKVGIGTEAQASAMTTTLLDYPNIIANAAAPFANLGRTLFTVPADGAYYLGFHAYSHADNFQLFLDSIVVREIPPVDVGVTATSSLPTCPTNDIQVTATVRNFNLLDIDFSAYPVTVTVDVTGSATTSVSTVINSGTLAAGATQTVTLPGFNLAAGAYTISTSTSSPDDGVANNNALNQFVVVNASPAAAVFTPAAPAVCEGGTLQLNTQFTAPAPAPTTMPAVSSGAINLPIPDGNVVGVNHTLTVSGIPATSVVTGISVTLNATHTWNADLTFTLRAPNGRILTLATNRGGNGDGYSNVIISSTGTATLPAGNTTPITGTFAPDATLGVGATGFAGNATSFADLYSVGNGNWTLAVRDGTSFDAGTLTSWSITITYGQPHPVVTWTPTTGLFTDAAATVPYVANSNAYSVYVKPAAATAYTVTSTSSFGCTTTRTVTVNVNPNPVVNIAQLPTRICVSDPEVDLAASPIGGSWSGSGVSGNSLIPPAVGTSGTFPLTYRYTDNQGCTTAATVQAKIDECPERVRLLRDDAVILFPNPNNGQFNIRINSTLYNKLTMRVYTTSGLAVRTQQFDGLAYGRVIPIDLTNLPSGSYMVQFLYFGGPRTSEKTFNVIVGK